MRFAAPNSAAAIATWRMRRPRRSNHARHIKTASTRKKPACRYSVIDNIRTQSYAGGIVKKVVVAI